MNKLNGAWQHICDHFIPSASNHYKPHVLHKRALHFYAGLLFSVKIATLFSLGLLPQDQAFSSAITVQNIIQLTNESRVGYGLANLKENSLLDSSAQAKANDMLQNQYFAHISPAGKTPWDWISGAGYNYVIAGENLAVNFVTAEGVEQAWMNSPGHKANILNKDFQDIGIGISEGQYNGVDAIFVVQDFGTSIDQPITPQNGFTQLQPNPNQPAAPANPQANAPAAPQSPVASSTNSSPAKPQTVSKKPQLLLQPPSLDSPGFFLTNKKTITVTGTAPQGDYVYIYDNHEMQDRFPVTAGKFSADIPLQEGLNTINAMAANGSGQISVISGDVSVQLDDVAPVISDTRVLPDQQGGSVYYKVEVQSQGDPVKILASLGGNTVMLQPTNNSGTWQGQVLASGQAIQGNITVTAYDLAGNSTLAQEGSLSGSVLAEYSFAGKAQPTQVSLFGRTFAANSVNNFYIYFVMFLIVSMIAAIAIKRNVQHVGMLAHASAMVVLAMVLWVI